MSEPALTSTTQTIGPESPPIVPKREPRSRAKSFAWQLQQAALIAALAVGCYFLISRFFVQSVTVVGMSMAPTLSDSEHYLLNRWLFYVRAPQRNDVVVIRDPSDNGYSVKRIVAVGGETVCVKEGAVYVNGRKLIEPYLSPGTPTFTSSFKEKVFNCRPGCYFLLGDNRKNSIDSRSYGPVPRQNILGLVVR